ncbi:hypothetical protein CENSYa_1219 [Cenarchaeum symbiosum A]|uniref:Uncharacterized protein n=1 Tax=Cenarchaeum symbiosum (strain A) TaxID=414004 RepID=A0RWX6_CENSY|nr:hypothetical protein CENSYa_1219 [Cenarchaeum symbiosum A]
MRGGRSIPFPGTSGPAFTVPRCGFVSVPLPAVSGHPSPGRTPVWREEFPLPWQRLVLWLAYALTIRSDFKIAQSAGGPDRTVRHAQFITVPAAHCSMKRGIAGAAIGSVAVLALMLAPSGVMTGQNTAEPRFYGMVEAIERDSSGQVTSSQAVHNRLLDAGEDLIIDSVFRTPTSGAPLAANERINRICLSNTNSSIMEDSALADLGIASSNEGTSGPCLRIDGNVDVSDDNIATLGPLNFTGGVSIAVDTAITAVVICANATGPSNSTCANGTAFAAVPLSSTLADMAMLELTYTFNVSSNTS